MKTILAVLLLASTTSIFAAPATRDEVKFLCETVDQILSLDTGIDAAVDQERCLKIKAKMDTPRHREGVRILAGRIPFNTWNGVIIKKCTIVILGAGLNPKNVLTEAFNCQ